MERFEDTEELLLCLLECCENKSIRDFNYKGVKFTFVPQSCWNNAYFNVMDNKREELNALRKIFRQVKDNYGKVKIIFEYK